MWTSTQLIGKESPQGVKACVVLPDSSDNLVTAPSKRAVGSKVYKYPSQALCLPTRPVPIDDIDSTEIPRPEKPDSHAPTKVAQLLRTSIPSDTVSSLSIQRPANLKTRSFAKMCENYITEDACRHVRSYELSCKTRNHCSTVRQVRMTRTELCKACKTPKQRQASGE